MARAARVARSIGRERGAGHGLVRPCPGQPSELLPLVHHARRRASGAGVRRASPHGHGPSRRDPPHAERRSRAAARHRVRRQLAGFPALRGKQHRGSRALSSLHQRAARGDVRGADPLHRRRDPQRSAAAGSALWRLHVRQSDPGQALPDARRDGRAGSLGARGPCRRLPARRAAADGRLPHAERTGPAHEPGQARLLGRATRARRSDPAAASGRSGAAGRRGEAGPAVAGQAGAAPQQSGVRLLSCALRCVRADAGELRADWRNADEGSRRTSRRYAGVVPRRKSREGPERPAGVHPRET